MQWIAPEQPAGKRVVDLRLDRARAVKVSPSPVSPVSVWTRTQITLANSSVRNVSIEVIFIAISSRNPLAHGPLFLIANAPLSRRP